MGARSDSSRLAAGLMGAVLLAQLAVLRLLSTANEQFVTLAGTELHWGCAFKSAFGVACPNCGMTRSVVFSLHGDFARAFEVNLAGPLLVFGGLALGLTLLFASLRPARAGAASSASFMRRLMLGTAAYGGLVFAVLLVNWVRAIS